MTLTMEQISLANLKGTINPDHRAYSSKEEALSELRALTGKDFGWDAAAWEDYLRQAYPHLPWKPRQ